MASHCEDDVLAGKAADPGRQAQGLRQPGDRQFAVHGTGEGVLLDAHITTDLDTREAHDFRRAAGLEGVAARCEKHDQLGVGHAHAEIIRCVRRALVVTDEEVDVRRTDQHFLHVVRRAGDAIRSGAADAFHGEVAGETGHGRPQQDVVAAEPADPGGQVQRLGGSAHRDRAADLLAGGVELDTEVAGELQRRDVHDFRRARGFQGKLAPRHQQKPERGIGHANPHVVACGGGAPVITHEQLNAGRGREDLVGHAILLEGKVASERGERGAEHGVVSGEPGGADLGRAEIEERRLAIDTDRLMKLPAGLVDAQRNGAGERQRREAGQGDRPGGIQRVLAAVKKHHGQRALAELNAEGTGHAHRRGDLGCACLDHSHILSVRRGLEGEIAGDIEHVRQLERRRPVQAREVRPRDGQPIGVQRAHRFVDRRAGPVELQFHARGQRHSAYSLQTHGARGTTRETGGLKHEQPRGVRQHERD